MSAWHAHVQNRRRTLADLDVTAQAMSAQTLRREAFKAWVDFVPQERAERARIERVQGMRAQVASWLPDFGDGSK